MILIVSVSFELEFFSFENKQRVEKHQKKKEQHKRRRRKIGGQQQKKRLCPKIACSHGQKKSFFSLEFSLASNFVAVVRVKAC